MLGERCSTAPRSSALLRFLAVDVMVGSAATVGSAVGGGGRLLAEGANGAYIVSMGSRVWEVMKDARNSRLLAIVKGVMAARGICGVWVRERAVRIT